jgi:hypothetical protein
MPDIEMLPCHRRQDSILRHAQNDIPARPQGDGRLRTTLEEKRVSARWGWAGEKGVIFSMLSAFLRRVGHKRRIQLLHLGAAALRAFHFAGFMFL